MERLNRWLMRLAAGEQGQDMVEYALITVMISVTIVVAVLLILPGVFTTWATAVADCVSNPLANC